jgi:prefoldin subunit 5
MKDIHEVLRQKQAQYAQLSKQIEALQAAADKLREVAPLLSEAEEDSAALVLNDAEETPRAVPARAAAAAAPASKAPRATTPRWP